MDTETYEITMIALVDLRQKYWDASDRWLKASLDMGSYWDEKANQVTKVIKELEKQRPLTIQGIFKS